MIESKFCNFRIFLLSLMMVGFWNSTSSYAVDVDVGSVSCKEWVTDRASESDYMNKFADQSWIIGFVSGYSLTTGVDFLVGVKKEAIFIWMDKYCASHTDNKIDDGSLILVHELIEKLKLKQKD